MPVGRRFAFALIFILGLIPAVSQAAGIQGDRLDRSFRLENAAAHVTLRSIAPGLAQSPDVIVVNDRAALDSVAYELTEMRGVIAAVPSERGIRFMTGNASRDLTLAAPTAIGADGRQSIALRWAIAPSSVTRGTLHLVSDDPLLKFPVTLTFGKQLQSNSSARRRFDARALVNGSIAGLITDAVSGAPLVDQFVFIFDSTGEFATYGTSDTTGNYVTVDGLATGTYYAFCSVADYVAELYNNINCDSGCTVTSGTPIAVVDGFLTSDVDFALQPKLGRVAGTVTGGASPLESVLVVVYDNASNTYGVLTDASGAYEISVPADASPYRARTFNNDAGGYIDQLYNGHECVDCNVATGDPITVNAGLTTSGINFPLNTGGRIAGSVTDGTNAINNAFIEIYDNDGDLVSTTQTDETGAYLSNNGLTAGTYYVRASAGAYVSELYDNIPCFSCTITSGTGVSVPTGGTVNNINFALAADTIPVSGNVKDATTSANLSGVNVFFYDNSGASVGFATTDASGNYSFVLASAGTYFAKTDNGAQSGYVEQLYDGIDCTGCDVTTGTAINAAPGSSVTGINFSLHATGGFVSGTVKSADTNTGIPFASVAIYNSTGEFVSFATADGSGNYTSFDGLVTGTYYATAWASGFATQLYNGINCATGCDVTTGTAILVTNGSTTTGINFQLGSAFARVSGTVTDASSNPLSGAQIDFYDATGTFAGSTTTNASGAYLISLSAGGNYYAIASLAGYSSELYNGHDCNGCDPLTGDPISSSIGTTTPNINFVLQSTGCAGKTLEPPTLPDGQVGVAYSAQLSTTNMTAPVTYAVTSGEFPDGLVLNGSTGAISGTPNAAGTFVFTITATDAASCAAGRNYTVEIAQTLTQTTTTVSASPNPSTYNQAVTLTATVTPEGATGTVVFKEGATNLGSASLDANGQASIVVTNFNAGTHTITAEFTSADPTYTDSTSAPYNVVVNKATPVFSNLSSPTIVIGTASTTITGKISAGTLIPPGTVSITINGVTQSATIQADGTFSSTFNTSALVPPGYTISFTYAGSTNFNSASATSTLTVKYATTATVLSTSNGNSGATVVFRIFVYNASGTNISASSLPVFAYGYRLSSSATWLEPTTTGNNDAEFDFQNAQGGSYKFNLKTSTQLAPGTYVFGYKIGADNTIHETTFTITQ